MSFADDIKKFSEKAEAKQAEVVVSTLFEINLGVIKATPVDTGRARGGWIASIGSPALVANAPIDKNGNATLRKANQKATRAAGNVYYLTNGVQYISILEYGGYPNPPEKGSWSKKKQDYEILSVGGYSQQAPTGMVRVTVKDVMGKLRLSNVGS